MFPISELKLNVPPHHLTHMWCWYFLSGVGGNNVFCVVASTSASAHLDRTLAMHSCGRFEKYKTTKKSNAAYCEGGMNFSWGAVGEVGLQYCNKTQQTLE